MLSTFVLCFFSFTHDGISYNYTRPIKYISSCELDLNDDDKSDIAFLAEIKEGTKLFILVNNKHNYITYVIPTGNNMILSCHYGDTVTETLAGKGKKEKPKMYKTPGTYLSLAYPEGPAAAYFWNGKGFTEVWIAD